MGEDYLNLTRPFPAFDLAINWADRLLKNYGERVDPGRWQGVPTEGKPDMVTKELLDLKLAVRMPASIEVAQAEIKPNLPWAEDHFQERVGRQPTNPGEQYKNWPWWRGQTESLTYSKFHDPGQFTHTYQERFWPKWEDVGQEYRFGIRFRYGDLDDVVQLLRSEPFGRQAYLPIFFPEDTGAVHGGRVPCSLGYHFLRRGHWLHCWYDIRSCDAVRHFRDDLYLAVRLVQWVIAELAFDAHDEVTDWVTVNPGVLYFKAHSFHVHMGDYHQL